MDLSKNLHLDELFEAACINRIIRRLEIEEGLTSVLSETDKLINEATKRKLTNLRDSLLHQSLTALSYSHAEASKKSDSSSSNS